MAKPYRFWTKPSGIIYVAYASDPKKWTSCNTRDPVEAEIFASRNDPKGDSLRVPTVGEFSATFFLPGKCTWLKRQAAKGRTYGAPHLAKMRGFVENYIIPRFGPVRMDDMSRRQIDDWLMTIKGTRTRKPLMADAKNKIIAALRIIFDDAFDAGMIQRNPCDGIQLFKDLDQEKRQIFTANELQQLFPEDIEALIDIWLSLRWALYFFLQASAGLRPGEVAALQWGDWYESAHGIVVAHSIEAVTRARKGTKTGIIKPIPLVKRAEAMLRLLAEMYPDHEPTDYIFSDQDGGPLLLETSLKHFKASCSRAKVERGKRTQYCLRHSFDTHAIKVLGLNDVKDLMGHKTLKHTIDTYYHPEDIDRIKALPNSVWSDLEKMWSTK